MAKWKEIRLSVDPFESVATYLDLLATYVTDADLWTNENCLRRAIRRYEQNWLPLAAEWKAGDIEAPRDVKWVWHLHMLHPRQYADYCRSKFGKIIAHKLYTSAATAKHSKERTAKIWEDKYVSEAYEIESEALRGTYEKSSVSSSHLLHVITSSSCEQQDFYYQVVLPHYRDGIFLRHALERYKQFLFLQKVEPQFCSDPPYDIQLVWRIHMLHPNDYVTDCSAILRRVLDPHDSHSEVSGQSRVAVSNAEDVWFSTFGQPLFIQGSTYRGSNVTSVIAQIPKQQNLQEIIDTCQLTLDDVCVSELWNKEKNIHVEGRRVNATSFSHTPFFRAKGKVNSAITSKDHKGLGTVHFEGKLHRGIQLHVYSVSGFGCTRAEQSLATVNYNPREQFENGSFFTRSLHVELPKVSASDPHVKFTCNVTATERKPHALILSREPFLQSALPKDLLEFVMSEPSWGQSIMGGASDTECTKATHTLKSKLGPLQFSVEVLKHEESDSNAVLVYLDSRQLTDTRSLVCVAHSIDPAQIAPADKVSATCPLYLDLQSEHAMLIHNHSGDWCIIKALWVSETTPGFGKVQLLIYDVASKAVTRYTIRDDEMQTIKLSHVTVDMPTGRITLGAGCELTAENIALAFCVGVLFLTCQRKAIMTSPLSGSVRSLSQIKLAGDNASESTLSGLDSSSAAAAHSSKYAASRFNAKSKLQQRKRTRRRKMSASFTFLLACGLQVESFYHSISQPPSLNGTLSRGDAPTITNRAGDVQFSSTALTNGGNMVNGQARVNHNDESPQHTDDQYMDIRL